MVVCSTVREAYASVAKADDVLKGWPAAWAVWNTLDEAFKADLLSAASDHIDALPFRFARVEDGQVRAFPLLCSGEAIGCEEAELACILQAVHLVMNLDQLADRGAPLAVREIKSTQTVCYEDSGDCVLYSLGAMLVLEGFVDLSDLSVDEE
ncbi:hypothetical protein N1030_00665 [Desulfovibrio mangrovi]|uniref:hypothetical protein n=1 Tax=Desulfovibrio mangrovi TaxID=2976983 RepID=UPI002246117A|nr:hypothetical protein [Desulfovibrio mangrovi]UZP67512.1 hypothetical protein N1030_00665 [Desulfovibrio mangrovi]